MSRPDLSDLEIWSDDDLMGALNDLEYGLNDNDHKWIGILQTSLDQHGGWSEKLRSTAESILTGWNERTS